MQGERMKLRLQCQGHLSGASINPQDLPLSGILAILCPTDDSQ